MLHYLYIEIDGIQRYVFNSPSLKAIRGASTLLDTFNRCEMGRIAGKIDKSASILLAGGGHCLMTCASKEAAESIGATLQRRLYKDTEGQAGLSYGTAPKSSYWSVVWTELSEDRQQRSLNRPPSFVPVPPFVAVCASCGISPASDFLAESGERSAICSSCCSRHDLATRRELVDGSIWSRLKEHLQNRLSAHQQKNFYDLLPEPEFEKIASMGSGQQYLAYLYCDGNSMGRFFDNRTSADDYAASSKRVDSALHEAVSSALLLNFAKNKKFSAEVSLLGGDDLVVVLPANHAIEFTCKVLEDFHQNTEHNLRLSAGLVFAPHKTPITILHRTATSLLRSAKRYAYWEDGQSDAQKSQHSDRGPLPSGYIDFCELTSTMPDLDRQGIATCRPYRLDDFERLERRIRAIRDAGVPRGRLYALAEAVQGSLREANTVTQMTVARAGDRGIRALCELLAPVHVDIDPREPPSRVVPFARYDEPGWSLPWDIHDQDAPRFSAVSDALELFDHVSTAELNNEP